MNKYLDVVLGVVSVGGVLLGVLQPLEEGRGATPHVGDHLLAGVLARRLGRPLQDRLLFHDVFVVQKLSIVNEGLVKHVLL